MENVQLGSETTAVDLARQCLYRFLSAALSDPQTQRWRLVLDSDNQRLVQESADLLRREAGTEQPDLSRGELPINRLDVRLLLGELNEPATPICAQFDRVFGLVTPRECPPYETEYHPTSEAFFRSQQLADVAGFYRAFGLEISHLSPERPDQIVLQLEFMSFVLTKKRLALTEEGQDGAERASVCDCALRRFLSDHFVWWVPAFATGLRRKAGSGYYAAVADLLAALVPAERCRLGIPAPTSTVQPVLIERPEEQSPCSECPIQLHSSSSGPD